MKSRRSDQSGLISGGNSGAKPEKWGAEYASGDNPPPTIKPLRPRWLIHDPVIDSEGVTSGANQTAGVPARATVEVCSREDYSEISAPAHRKYRSARWSHPTYENLTTSKWNRHDENQAHAKTQRLTANLCVFA